MIRGGEMTGGWWWQVADSGEWVAALDAWRFKSPNTREGLGGGRGEGSHDKLSAAALFLIVPFLHYC